MKRFLSRAVIVYTLFYVRAAYASSMLDSLKSVGDKTYGGTPQPLKVTIANIVRILLGFLGIVFIILILWGGIQWMVSGGNEKKIAEAKQRLVSATIGLVVVFAAYSIARFVYISLLRSTGSASPTSGN